MKLQFVLAFVVSFVLSVSQAGKDNAGGGYVPPSSKSDINQLMDGGDGDHYVPIPWGAELPFPWTIVSGIWMAKYGNFESFFDFKVIKEKQNSAGIKQVEVHQIDSSTCQVIAKGMGYAQNRVVRAQMISEVGSVYRISLRAFRETALPSMEPINSQVVVLSIYPIESRAGYHMPINKVAVRSSFRCPN